MSLFGQLINTIGCLILVIIIIILIFVIILLPIELKKQIKGEMNDRGKNNKRI